jgi:serine/threonine-protein kinase
MSDLLRDRLIVAVGDQYDVQGELGRGGMAIVYRAVDVRLRRQVAIKLLPPDLAFRPDVRSRFLREAATAAQLSHPNIVPIYTVDEREGLVYFVMGCVDGQSLAGRLAREGRIPIADARRILQGVADALGYAHEHGVIHRDVKPDNILLDARTGRPLVTDFGIARAAEADSRLTVTGFAVGTPAYMSPEQAMGEREVDGRSDIYSLGIVAYQMLAGELPFTASNTPAMMMKHLSERPRPLASLRRDVPAALAAAVERAMAKKPEERFTTAYQLRDAIASDVPIAPPPAPPPRTVRRAAPLAPPAAQSAPWPPLPPSEHARVPVHRGRRRRGRESMESFAELPLERRIAVVRRELVANSVWIAAIGAINVVTSDFPWVVFPAAFMLTSVLTKAGTLWAEGVRWRDIFSRSRSPGTRQAPGPRGAIDEQVARLVPADVLRGPRGEAVRNALGDKAAIVALLEALPAPDRALLPEVMPTVDALVERTANLAQTLHHLDADLSSDTITQLDERIAAVEAESADSTDHERRLNLLHRQRATLRDLAERRARAAAQLESARIALENLRFDLIKLRSSGVQSALQDVNNATQEARALSRDIGYVVDAAAEVKKL